VVSRTEASLPTWIFFLGGFFFFSFFFFFLFFFFFSYGITAALFARLDSGTVAPPETRYLPVMPHPRAPTQRFPSAELDFRGPPGHSRHRAGATSGLTAHRGARASSAGHPEGVAEGAEQEPQAELLARELRSIASRMAG